MSITPKFITSKEAKENGWFSRRHPTNKEHLEAQRKRLERTKKKDNI